MRYIVRRNLILTVIAIFAVHLHAQNAISSWNQVAEEAVRHAGTPPPVAALDFAIVHLAIYNAVESLDRRYEPYGFFDPNAGGSITAAAAKAGHDVLVVLLPSQAATVDSAYLNFMAENSLSLLDPGTEVGAQSAADMLGRGTAITVLFPPSQAPYTGSTLVGQWRPTSSLLPGPPPSFAPGLTPWVKDIPPFTMYSNSQFRVDPPPTLTSEQWAEDYNEVKSLGSLTSTTRTADQTQIGYFWADNGPALWQSALRDISDRYVTNIGESARMFALAETALADAQIACWESKYYYNFWRPITAIRLGDKDGNPATEADINWQPLINTPNFPEYPSGHASTSGAITRALQLFFGTDQVSFQMTTKNGLAAPKTRTFDRLSQAEDEVIDARVYVGFHYRTSDRAARTQGMRVANWVFKNYFRPIGDPRFGAEQR